MTDTTHPFDALMEITARPPVVFVRGAGSYLWDDSRKRYLDFVQGWAVNALGHSPPAVAEALAAQAKLLLTPSPAFYNGPSLKLAKALVENSSGTRVFFANSGAEANEGAIKRGLKPIAAPSSRPPRPAQNTRTARSHAPPSKAAFPAAAPPRPGRRAEPCS